MPGEKERCFMLKLGNFTVDVDVQENGLYDVWIAHEGDSGSHYKDVTSDRIGELVADEIECVKEGMTS